MVSVIAVYVWRYCVLRYCNGEVVPNALSASSICSLGGSGQAVSSVETFCAGKVVWLTLLCGQKQGCSSELRVKPVASASFDRRSSRLLQQHAMNERHRDRALADDAIREGQEYGGMRVKLIAMIGNVRIPLQVDVGTGDAVVPHRKSWTIPASSISPAHKSARTGPRPRLPRRPRRWCGSLWQTAG